MATSRALILLCLTGCTSGPTVGAQRRATPTLVALATLPALTFGEGPPSGARIQREPFPSQPIQGFSALLAEPDGGFLVVSDNGYGAAENSADFLLRVSAVRADFDAGAMTATTLFTLRDPDRTIAWPVVNHFTSERLLTGADLDPESMVRAPDGTFWFGDEHGPFLVHTDATGRLLEAPVPLVNEGTTLRSPDNPFLRENLVLRSLEALNAFARAHDARAPILSPDHRWLSSADQLKQLHRAGFKVIPWTVNDVDRMTTLIAWGIDGLITDRPDLVHDAGLEVQGHRGARGLAPENTRAAFEAGLAAGVNTLELELSPTADGQLVVWHDEKVGPPKCRAPELTLAQVPLNGLERVRCDGLLPEFPAQRADAGAAAYKLLTLAQLLRFPGKLNLETKVHTPSSDPVAMTRCLAKQVQAADAGQRVTLQSFDWRSLTTANADFPWLQTVALMGEPTTRGDDVSRAGLPWPVAVDPVATVKRSGGFENLALSPDGRALYAMLEKPLGPTRECLAFSFDLATKQFTGVAFRFPLHERATAVGDFVLADATHGYALERDDSEGKLDGYKRVIRFTLPSSPGGVVARESVVDLLALPTLDGGVFAFPFWTTEGIAVLPGGRLAIVNDNNLPFGHARSKDAPDGTELIIVELSR